MDIWYKGTKLNPEQSLATWQCCASMEEHMDHLRHLKRVYEEAQAQREINLVGLQELLKALDAEVKVERPRPKLRLIRGGKV